MIGAAATAGEPAPDGAGAGAISARSLGLSPEGHASLLRTLRFRHFKWDTYVAGGCRLLPDAMVLTREAHQAVAEAAEGLHRALGRFERRVRRDPAALDALGIPRALHPLIAEEEHDTLQIARYDFFPTPDGRWMVSEFNEDVPGGFNEAAGLPELLGDPGGGLRWEGDLRAAFVAAFEPYETVALLYATAFSEDLQHILILQRWLEAAGHRTVLGSPAHLGGRWLRWGGPRILGAPVDAAFRFYPGEWMPKLPNFTAWLRLGARLPAMNPVHRLVRQSKRMFALWPDVCPEDRALLEAHCPGTVAVDGTALRHAQQEPGRWVLKRAFGRMGDSVVIGALVSEAAWAAALNEAARAPGEFCLQARFDVRPIPFDAGPLYPAVGVFLVNGRFAGYYSRAAREPLITHEAYHVATLVEGA